MSTRSWRRWWSCGISPAFPKPRSPPCSSAPNAACAATGRRRACTCSLRCRTELPVMEGDRWKALSPLLDDLLELSGRARQQRLSMIQATDPGLAADLSRLMDLEEERPDFMSQPVVSGDVGMQAGDEIGPYKLASPLG